MQAVVDSILGNAKEALKTVSREAFNNTIKWINGVSAVVVSIIPGAREGGTWSSFTHPIMPRWMETGVSDFNRMVSEFTHSDQNLLSESGSESDSDGDPTSFFSHHNSRHNLFKRSRRFITGMFHRNPTGRRESGHFGSPFHSEQGSTHPSRRVSAAGGGLPKSNSDNTLSRRMSDVWHSAFPFSDRNRSAQKGLLEELQFQLERLIDWSFELAQGVTYYILSPSEGLRLLFWRMQGIRRSQSSGHVSRDEEPTVTTVEQIIIDAGYPYEAHRVVTGDGYILRLERIPRRESRRAVILQHGLLDSALGWVANGVVGSQAFAAYDQGYDVWLGNFRGYTSREHINPSISKRDYWDYTVLEHAREDVGGMVQCIHDVKTAELPPISPRSSYHSATTQPSTPNSLDDLPEPSPHSLEGIGVPFGEEDAILAPSHVVPQHLIPDAESEGSRKEVVLSSGTSKRSSFGGGSTPSVNTGYVNTVIGWQDDDEADSGGQNGAHQRQPSKVSSYGDADDSGFSDIEEEMPAYTLSGIAHSLGGMALIVYVILKRIEGKPHRLARLILLSPAGYHEKTPFLLDILQWLAPAAKPIFMRVCPGLYIPTRALRHIFSKLVQDFQSLPALRALAHVLIRTFILGGDNSNWINALELPHYSTENMPGIAFQVANHLRQCKWYKRFQLFDFGRSENLRRYGTEKPLNVGAHYNLIDIPVDLVVGTKDGLIPAEMIYKHYTNMRRNGVEVSIKEFDFAHLDFTFENKQELMSYVMSRLALGSSAEAHTPAAQLRSIVQGERVAERIASAKPEDKASVTGTLPGRRLSQSSSFRSVDSEDFEMMEARRDQQINGHASTSYDVINGRRCVSLGGAGDAPGIPRPGMSLGDTKAHRSAAVVAVSHKPRRSSDGGAALHTRKGLEVSQSLGISKGLGASKSSGGSKSRKEKKKREFEDLSFEQLLASDEEGVVEVDSERLVQEFLGGRGGGRPLSWPDQGVRSPGKEGPGRGSVEDGVRRRSSRHST